MRQSFHGQLTDINFVGLALSGEQIRRIHEAGPHGTRHVIPWGEGDVILGGDDVISKYTRHGECYVERVVVQGMWGM